ncbi:hypothetical protein [Ferrovibrio sp.]|uniref:Y-family DNA polymerase n=1 Tax=Ferrovibrio sp. TaxID=1917215 RepID=UPI0025BA5C4F|nr:hypothetical protein [Ferrovibrio sp.]MBX3455423.1 hypothetical protein [Ferrovibrio sp.]
MTQAWESSSLRWLYLDLNSYFASVEQQVRPRLRGRPMAVVPVMTDATSAIAASYEAKAFGIKTGTPIWEAKRLCPDIALVPARHDLYVDYHHRILDEIDKYIPVSKIGSIDEMACELMGDERLPQNAIAIAKRLKAGLKRNVGECILCSIGIAPNAFLAKVASDLKKPDGLTVLHLADLPGPLLSLKLRDLPGIGANMEKRLNDAGVTDMPGLWNLGAREARTIWGGIGGEQFWRELRGEQVQRAEHGRHTISHSHVLPPELRPVDAAEAVARRLAAKTVARVRRIGHKARQLHLSVRFDDGGREKWTGDFRLTETQDSFVVLQAVQTLWARMRKEAVGPLRRRLRKVGVVLGDLVPEQATTADLFGGGSGFEPEPARAAARVDLAKALDELNKRYGRDTVHIGPAPGQGQGDEAKEAAKFMGAKIAFNRIPERAEFDE